jgi:hypothetical protein
MMSAAPIILATIACVIAWSRSNPVSVPLAPNGSTQIRVLEQRIDRLQQNMDLLQLQLHRMTVPKTVPISS